MRNVIAVFGMILGPTLAAAPYVPRPVALPAVKDSYVMRDGSIYYAGNDLVDELFHRFDEMFERAHPGFKFKSDMIDSNLAVAGLAAGVSAMGPIGREAMPQEVESFVARYGYAPTDFLIGYDQTPDPDIFPPGKRPPAIWINSRNPLPKLTVAQLARIVTMGGGSGDITTWKQLGIGGEWAIREIHVYLPANRDAAFLFNLDDRLGGFPYTSRAELLPGVRDVMSAVAQDPYGIAVMGYWPGDAGWDRQAELGALAKLVPMAADAEGTFSHAQPGELYPLTPGIHILINKKPGQPLEPWIADYLRLVYSDEGQAIFAEMAKAQGFIPLEPEELAKQVARLHERGEAL